MNQKEIKNAERLHQKLEDVISGIDVNDDVVIIHKQTSGIIDEILKSRDDVIKNFIKSLKKKRH